jgi:hypothetical protein
MDLTQTVPRSPYERLGGIVFLPRAIDKMRAHLAGTKGEYNSHFGTSERLLRVLFGLTADAFERIVREHPTDEGVLDTLLQRVRLSPQDIEDWNAIAIFGGPLTEEDWTLHWQRLEASGHGHRREIVTQFDRLDLDEGREVPLGGRRAQLARDCAVLLVSRIRARRTAAGTEP